MEYLDHQDWNQIIVTKKDTSNKNPDKSTRLYIKLSLINILNDNGTLNENVPKESQNLTVIQAREKDSMHMPLP